MKFKNVEEITSVLLPVATSMGIEIVEVEAKVTKNSYITVYIDTENGVDLDTCEKFHNAIDPVLDELDPSYGAAYTLNVSSLGVDRPFKTDKDFLSHIGERVEVKLYSSIRGKKFYDGILVSYDGKVITLKVDEKTTFTIDLKNTVKVNEYIDFQ